MPIYYIDGGSQGNERKGKPRNARIAIAYSESSHKIDPATLEVYWEAVGDKTNNEAEYLALLKALELISEKVAKNMTSGTEGELLVRSDSTLIVNQVKGEFQVKEPRLRELNERAKEALQKLGSVRLEWVPRSENYAGLWIEGVLRPLRIYKLSS